MTKPGKCDSCRQRKVKCDELRPTCAVCQKGGRICSYTYGKAARFVSCPKTRRNRRRGPASRGSGASSNGGESSFSDSPSPPGSAVSSEFAGSASGSDRGPRPHQQPSALSPSLPTTPQQEKQPQPRQHLHQPGGSRESGKAVVLSLRSTREAKHGNGLFHTFVPLSSDRRTKLTAAHGVSKGSQSRGHHGGREPNRMSRSPLPLEGADGQSDMALTSSLSPNPSPRRRPSPLSPFNPDPLHNKTRVLARWRALIGSGGPDEASHHPVYAFGDWIELVASQIVESSAVEAAAVSLINSTNAYVYQGVRGAGSLQSRSCYVEEVSKSNEVALRAVRMALYESNPRGPPRLDVLIAVKLLSTVELFMGAKTNFYRRHALVMINMLVNMYPRGGVQDQVSLHMFYASCFTDASVAILSGRDSIFDTPSWLGTPPPANSSSAACPNMEVALQYNMQTFVRVPRLIRLVRRARAQPQDAAARAEAQTLAAELFGTDLRWWVGDMVRIGALAAGPTSARPGLEPSRGESLSFSSPRLFSAAIMYWMARVLVCGCVQALCDLAPLNAVPNGLDREAARAEDVRAATSIAMCAQYAARTGSMMPVVQMRLQMPVMISFGAWHRLEVRSLMMSITGYGTPATDAGGAHARRMKEWCVSISRDIGAKWNAVLTDMADMEEKTEGFAGGPLCFAGPKTK